MGRTGGSSSSWLTAVKRAFRSPTKDNNNNSERSSSRRPRHHLNQDHDPNQQQEAEENKKREKKGWLFRKPTSNEGTLHQKATNSNNSVSQAEQRHAIAVAVATAKAAEAAVATAQAAVEVARLAGPLPPSYYVRENYAATLIQTAFRGYLARRALRALKGLVKLQALVRGHNVRKQAKMTLQCMQALVRVQARVLDQRIRQSNDGSSRKSTFSDTNSLLESRCLDICDRKSMSRDGSSIADDWDERAHSVEEVKAMLHRRQEYTLKREKNLSHAFSQQMWRSNMNKSFGNEDELGLDRWMPTKPWEGSKGRASTDQRDYPSFKTVEIDNTSQAQASYSYLPPIHRRTNQHHHQRSSSQCPSSPLHRSHQNHQYYHQSPTTPSPSTTRPVQARSASPRYHRPQTPSLRSNYYYNGILSQNKLGFGNQVPNYMAATESARARARSHSAPRQRPLTPDRERVGVGSAKKRLSYPVPEPYNYSCTGHHMRSPSFMSLSGIMHMDMGVEQQSNYSSCYTESHGGEISPSSTTDLRRWFG